MTDSFGTLLKNSWNFSLVHIKPILIGAVIIGLLSFGAQKLLETQATGSIENSFGDIEKIEELSKRMEEGDEAAFNEMMMQLGVMGDEGEMNEEALESVTQGFLKGMMPAFGTFFLVMMLITLVASSYFLVLAVEGGTAAATWSRVPKLLLPMLGVWIWSFLRSFAWIPFIGVIIALIIGPRLFFSSVILVKEGTGVLESVRLSYSRTRGYWAKIVGNMLLMAVVVWVVMLIVFLGLGLVSTASMLVGSILGVIVQQLVTAYGTVFTVKLADTVMANPLTVAEKKSA